MSALIKQASSTSVYVLDHLNSVVSLYKWAALLAYFILPITLSAQLGMLCTLCLSCGYKLYKRHRKPKPTSPKPPWLARKAPKMHKALSITGSFLYKLSYISALKKYFKDLVSQLGHYSVLRPYSRLTPAALMLGTLLLSYRMFYPIFIYTPLKNILPDPNLYNRYPITCNTIEFTLESTSSLTLLFTFFSPWYAPMALLPLTIISLVALKLTQLTTPWGASMTPPTALQPAHTPPIAASTLEPSQSVAREKPQQDSKADLDKTLTVPPFLSPTL